MVKIFLLFTALAMVAIFSIQNATPVVIALLFWKFEASLALVVFLSALCGIVAGAVIVSLLRRTQPKENQNKTLAQ